MSHKSRSFRDTSMRRPCAAGRRRRRRAGRRRTRHRAPVNMAPVEGMAGSDANKAMYAAIDNGIQTGGIPALVAAMVACGVDPSTPGGPFHLMVPFFTAYTDALTGKKAQAHKKRAKSATNLLTWPPLKLKVLARPAHFPPPHSPPLLYSSDDTQPCDPSRTHSKCI